MSELHPQVQAILDQFGLQEPTLEDLAWAYNKVNLEQGLRLRMPRKVQAVDTAGRRKAARQERKMNKGVRSIDRRAHATGQYADLG